MPPQDHRDDDTIPDSWSPSGDVRPEPRSRLQPGDVIARRFVIAGFLGAGGMGEVYEAEDRFLQGAHVALKAILAGAAAIPSALTRFEREVLLARQITHPNVCPVYDIVHTPDTPGFPCFIAMKLLREETLAARLQRQGRIGPEEAVPILRQIAAALRAAHQAKVLHRDLKPGNIMLEGAGAGVQAVVTDFGLALEYEPDLTAATGGYILGTPGYIAPEITNGRRATPACDLYSLGVMLHEMLTGQRPSADRRTGRPMLSPDLTTVNAPRFCVLLIEACLDADPGVRNKGFEQAVETLNPSDSRLPEIYPTSRSFTRRRVLAGGASAGLALGGGLWWNRDHVDDWLRPLPKKRFVALMTWPADTNKDTKPILSGVLDAIESVLARAEAVDRDLFVISHSDVIGDTGVPTKLTQVRDSLGANLVLATSGAIDAKTFLLGMKVMDASSNAVLRVRNLACAMTQLATLPAQAVRAAAALLSISLDDQEFERVQQPTNSPEAYKAFQSAEELFRRPNFEGLDGAIQNYSNAINRDPLFALAYARLAFAYCALYDVKHDSAALNLARRSGERALELNSKLIDAHLALSTFYELTGNRRRALDEVGTALLLDPRNLNTLNWQATIYQHMNRWKDAEQTYKRILAQHPNNWLAYSEFGSLLSDQGKYSEAIEAFREATIAAPGVALAYNNLGALYLKVGNVQKATESFRESLAIKENGDTLAGAAAALRAQGKYSEALVFAQKAVRVDASNHWNWGELGDCFYSMKGEQKNAYEAYFRASTEVERELHTEIGDGPGWMRLALYRVKCNAHDIVLPLVSKAERLGATDLDSQLAKVRILEISGKRKEALAAANEALKKGMTEFEVAYAPDLRGLRNDPEYVRMLDHKSAEAGN